MGQLWRRIQYRLHRDQHAADLSEEMSTHLALRAARLQDQGMSVDEAGMAARRQFGNRTELKIASDAVWGWTALEQFVVDLGQALRSFRRTPGFAILAVLTLTIGLGMNTAVFSIVNAVMLRGLPYPRPDRLVSLWEQTPERLTQFSSSGIVIGGMGGTRRTNVAAANLIDYRAATAFQGLASLEARPMNLTGTGAPERILGEAVTANYLTVLGVTPAIGRDFQPEDERPGALAVMLISHTFWQQSLGGDPAVLSRTVTFDHMPYSIIGVLPMGFQPVTQFGGTDRVAFLVPAAYSKEQLARHGEHGLNVIGRLRDGVTLRSAQEQLRVISGALGDQYPDTNKGLFAVIAPLRDDLVYSIRDSLVTLWCASGLIVLITCANVVNLLLVRANGRRHETSVRLALGAGRIRILRQFLAESLLLSGAGGAGGLILGDVLMRVLVAAAPPNMPRLTGVAIDWTVFLAATGLALITGIAFALVLTWQASGAAPAESLKTSERKSAGRTQAGARNALTVLEVAVSIVLVVGAGLFLKSFARIMGTDLGFRTEDVLAMNVQLPQSTYASPDDRLRFFQQLEAKVRVLPGVRDVAFANRFPMRGSSATGIDIEGLTNPHRATDSQSVSPGYFSTLGLTLLRGRLISPADRVGQPPVAVVNQTFARAFLNDAEPIGHRFRLRSDRPWVTIVGMVSDIRRNGKLRTINPQIYLAAAQTDVYPARLADFAVRASGDPQSLLNDIQRQVWSLDKDQPLTGIRTMQELLDLSVSEQRFEMLLLLAFAAVAGTLAIIGISGVLTYYVNQRMHEIGVRIALGAPPVRIVSMVLSQAGLMIGIGVLLGIAGALALMRLVSNLLFLVKPDDITTYVAAVGLVVLVSFLAALIPARRGARVDPLVALRYE